MTTTSSARTSTGLAREVGADQCARCSPRACSWPRARRTGCRSRIRSHSPRGTPPPEFSIAVADGRHVTQYAFRLVGTETSQYRDRRTQGAPLHEDPVRRRYGVLTSGSASITSCCRCGWCRRQGWGRALSSLSARYVLPAADAPAAAAEAIRRREACAGARAVCASLLLHLLGGSGAVDWLSDLYRNYEPEDPRRLLRAGAETASAAGISARRSAATEAARQTPKPKPKPPRGPDRR